VHRGGDPAQLEREAARRPVARPLAEQLVGQGHDPAGQAPQAVRAIAARSHQRAAVQLQPQPPGHRGNQLAGARRRAQPPLSGRQQGKARTRHFRHQADGRRGGRERQQFVPPPARIDLAAASQCHGPPALQRLERAGRQQQVNRRSAGTGARRSEGILLRTGHRRRQRERLGRQRYALPLQALSQRLHRGRHVAASGRPAQPQRGPAPRGARLDQCGRGRLHPLAVAGRVEGHHPGGRRRRPCRQRPKLIEVHRPWSPVSVYRRAEKVSRGQRPRVSARKRRFPRKTAQRIAAALQPRARHTIIHLPDRRCA
jgi:hypothetical protein